MLWRGFQKPKRLAVESETLTNNYGKFSAQPFERGFGTTIGNALSGPWTLGPEPSSASQPSYRQPRKMLRVAMKKGQPCFGEVSRSPSVLPLSRTP